MEMTHPIHKYQSNATLCVLIFNWLSCVYGIYLRPTELDAYSAMCGWGVAAIFQNEIVSNKEK